ncbi:DEAD/DEAH box helicase [Aliarcobacter cryaerophilus]|jgi:superfamily I DNA and RNA helicase|uniref:DEAD/DEAH box helicase n=1 Tax=Aliarcobacter cryaerophilus TaxID=28198 RepID=UPI003DA28B83
MESSLFYCHVEKNGLNQEIIENLEKFVNENKGEQIYIINAPLSENKYSYDYQENALVLLSPNHKIIFIDLKNNINEFKNYYDDFIEDLSSLSDKYKYKEFIGRPREWKNILTVQEIYSNNILETLLKNKISIEDKRKNEFLISLLIGSINDIEKKGIETPKTILEKVKNNILLFDGQQTRFIYKEFDKRTISIQGLSGTGKTELLLHKLKELYTSKEELKIFFTCHNIALANTLKQRVPEFFNFMKVDKQLEWNKQIWLDRAWGSQKDKNSGLYSYICHFYNIPFKPWSSSTSYKDIFTNALEQIKKIDESEFKWAFDYILIDERQDFPQVFFELCEKITKEKVYIAGDIFQDIFQSDKEVELDVDFVLNKCYRTDPRTLMFAHAMGMGLFDNEKINWLSDAHWEASGYELKRKENREVNLYREPVKRFEDIDQTFESMIIQEYKKYTDVIDIILNIKENHENVTPDDIAIIILNDGKTIYEHIDKLEFEIREKLGWEINRAFDSKNKVSNTIFVSNKNNVKGLEFPFVICLTQSILNDYRYRNTLYTMLTRSFLQSYLLAINFDNMEIQKNGLEIINRDNYIKTIEPTKEEKAKIQQNLLKIKEEKNLSYYDFLTTIFNELKIDSKYRKKLEEPINNAIDDKFNKELIIKFIEANKEFYCK